MFDLDALDQANNRREKIFVPTEYWQPFMEACEALGILWITGTSATQPGDKDRQLSEPRGQTIHMRCRNSGMARSIGPGLSTMDCRELLVNKFRPIQPDDLASLLNGGSCYV